MSEAIDNGEDFYKSSGMRDKFIESIKKIRLNTRFDDERRYRFTEKMIESKSVLDFGCGDGGYLIKAKQVANSVCGIELEDMMRESLLLEGIDCKDSIDKAGKYDVITLFHVLEHLENPIEYLEKFKKHLNSNGVLIIEVPNANDALLSLYNSKTFANFTYWKCHIYLYNMMTLQMLARRVGLKVRFMRLVQRYSLANHLYWLSKGKPGGHYEWSFLEDSELDKCYANVLEKYGLADTIIAGFEIGET